MNKETATCDDVPHCGECQVVLNLPDLPQPPVVTPDELRERIISLLRQNKTSSEIAKELGITRNSVSGIKHRYNRRHPEARVGRVKDIAGFKPGPAPKTKSRYVMWRGKPKIKLPESFSETGYVPRNAKPIHQLEENECKFAVTPHGTPPDKHKFCGHPTLENSPYCELHHRRCRETVNDRKGRSKSDPARGSVRITPRLYYRY